MKGSWLNARWATAPAAGSLDGDPLRQCYQQVEPLVYYHLPPDTPDARKLELCDASAPRRLFYVPSAGGLQVCGQVCYRATDSEGRPGAYFAHLVVQNKEEGAPRWSPLRCVDALGRGRLGHARRGRDSVPTPNAWLHCRLAQRNIGGHR